MILNQLLVRRTVMVCACAGMLIAGQTHTWSEGDYADFQKGVIKNLSVRSDGVLTLSPRWKELYDSSAMYLWSLARDSKGVIYAGGGTGAKLHRIGTDGKGKVLAELDGLEVHAVAVDSKDRVYAATDPDGKVYRVPASGKPEVFYDPKAKYIWAMAFDSKDNLYIATGDKGEVHRVTPDGKGQLFFQCEQDHARSLAIDPSGNVIVGTDPGGLVLRVSPAGQGFVLYQMAKPEVTALAIGSDGSIYASSVGSRQATLTAQPAAPAQARAPGAVTVTLGAGQPAVRQAAPAPIALPAPIRVTGGSDVFQIRPNGDPRRLWTNNQDVVYAIGFDGSGHVLLGTGDHGNIYRIESPTVYTALLDVPVTQVTAFLPAPGGKIYAAAGNVGKVYELDSDLEPQGTIESEVFDSGIFTEWGRLSFEAQLNGGRVSIQTRSGNLDQPQKNWSPWSDAIATPAGARITSPSSRFVQWKATLSASGGRSPELESVDVAYLSKNMEPRVDLIDVTPANYKFPAPSANTPSQNLTLTPLGRTTPRAVTRTATLDTPETTTPAMQPAKGFMGVRWMASDPNEDTLRYRLEIRGVNETQWKLLKDKVAEKYYSWDSTTLPDGEYRLRVIASDAPSNPPDQALTAMLDSDPFIVDNTPPAVTGLTATRNGGKLEIRWHAADALNDLSKAEVSLDGGDWTVVSPTTGLSDSKTLDYLATIDAAPGEHTIAVRVSDDYDNQGAEKTVVR